MLETMSTFVSEKKMTLVWILFEMAQWALIFFLLNRSQKVVALLNRLRKLSDSISHGTIKEKPELKSEPPEWRRL